MRAALLICGVTLLVVTAGVAPGVALEASDGPATNDTIANRDTGVVVSPQLTEPPAATDFGYGSMTVDGEPASGVRPLLVVIVESPPAANRSGIAYDVDYYDRLLFGYDDVGVPVGDGTGRNVSVNDLFIENSRGQFSWSKAGGKIYGPITYPSNEEFIEEGGFEDGEFDGRLATPKLVAERGFDFSRYDRDGDGTVSRDELGILVIGDRGTAGGQTIGMCARVDTPDSGKIDVCTGASGVGHRASLSLISHELGHQLGAPHFYGAEGRMKSRTIMGPSRGADDHMTFHFDPWNKIQLGWARPQVYSIPELQAAGQCANPGVLDGSGLYSDRDRRAPVILYDPARYDPSTKTGEYYIMEWRETTSYDTNLQGPPGGRGLAIWYVQTEDGVPKAIPALIRGAGPSEYDDGSLDSEPEGDDVVRDGRIYPGPNGIIDTTVPEGPDGEALDVDPIPTDVMNFLVAPGRPESGAPTLYNQRGRFPFWGVDDAEARLRWFDGTEIGVPVKLQWYFLEGPVLNLNSREMHFDADRARTVVATPGEEVTLYGHFVPQSSDVVVRIARDGETVAELDRPDAGVTLWTCDEIHVHIPNHLDYGEYELYAYDPTTDTRSDSLTLDVRADVDYASWFGTYEGRLDGREAELAIEPGFEFDIVVELRDLERDVTYRGTTTGPTTNVLRDVTLESDAGATRTVDALYLQGDERLSGYTDVRRGNRGLAFSTDASEWASTGEALATPPTLWSEQWLGTYDGYVDDERAELRVLEAADAGLGYVYEVELEVDGITYRGDGSVLLGSPHVMQFGRPLDPTTTRSGGVEAIRLPRLRLHAWDTNYVSGWATASRYGSGGVGAYFVREADDEIPPYIGGLVDTYNANADAVPESARSVFGDQRINLVVTSTAHPLEAANGSDTATRVRRDTQAEYGIVTADPEIERVTAGGLSDPTMTVRIRRDRLDAIVDSDAPGDAFMDHYRGGSMAVEPVRLGDRVTLGVGGVVSNLAARFSDDGPGYPTRSVERLAGHGGLSRNAGRVRQSEVVTLPDDRPVAGYEDVGGLRDDVRRSDGGTARYIRAMKGGSGVVDAVRQSR